ncbi:LacI family DNA-binding transcriptional regulator [Microbacterium sp.]|uniref:LacI family DNA-binding transcriptional regulator n=1 Tax=Microbacterium sp. TaxID=51671 RepID=UPI0039E647B3
MREARGRATLHAVAERAGVSLKTASNVVNGTGRMSDDTRRRVLAAIDDLDYKVNVAARSLTLGRTNAISLAVPTLKSPYLAELAEAFVEDARSRGYAVYVTTYPDDRADGSREYLRSFNPYLSDGLLLSMSEQGDLDADDLRVSFPVVALGSRLTGGAVDRVTTDDVEDARAATAYLFSRGSTRIAVVGAHSAFDESRILNATEGNAEQRLRGIVQACQEQGAPLDPALIAVTGYDWTIGAGFRGAEELLARGREFDGLLCLNDGLAIGAIWALREHGHRVPEDIQVIGFDNIEEAAYLSPALTSMDSRIEWIAKTALDRLIARIEGSQEPAEDIWAPSRLVPRGTTR